MNDCGYISTDSIDEHLYKSSSFNVVQMLLRFRFTIDPHSLHERDSICCPSANVNVEIVELSNVRCLNAGSGDASKEPASKLVSRSVSDTQFENEQLAQMPVDLTAVIQSP